MCSISLICHGNTLISVALPKLALLLDEVSGSELEELVDEESEIRRHYGIWEVLISLY